MATLDLKQIRKTYRNADNETLKGIDIARFGEFWYLSALSGCGKSTRMNTIAGLENISSGEIAFDGVDVAQVEPKDRDIAMVFQSCAIIQTWRYAASSPRLEDPRCRRTRSMLKWIASLKCCNNCWTANPHNYRVVSVSVWRWGVLGASSCRTCLMSRFLTWCEAAWKCATRSNASIALNTTIVYVTHDQIEAMTLADRIAVMKDGGEL